MRKNSRFYPAPGYTLYRELLPRLDLDAFEKALNGWLDQHRGQLPSTLAFDGKCIRENLGAIVSDQVALENTTLIADSLHTNATNAHSTVSFQGADFIAPIEDNQP